jgi:cytidine deaminase
MKLSSEQQQLLLEAAIAVRHWAYVPYSHYAVGAAVLTSSGKVYDGVNVESAAYPTTMCAERVAIFKAISEGERSFDAIAVVTENAGSPCGSCRQIMAEFGPDAIVLIADVRGVIKIETTVPELLPQAFTLKDLPQH